MRRTTTDRQRLAQRRREHDEQLRKDQNWREFLQQHGPDFCLDVLACPVCQDRIWPEGSWVSSIEPAASNDDGGGKR